MTQKKLQPIKNKLYSPILSFGEQKIEPAYNSPEKTKIDKRGYVTKQLLYKGNMHGFTVNRIVG